MTGPAQKTKHCYILGKNIPKLQCRNNIVYSVLVPKLFTSLFVPILVRYKTVK